MTSYPFWVSNTNVGSFADGFSLTGSPITLIFGETANQPCVVSLLNGSLPPGAVWNATNSSVIITGQLTVDATSDFEWTFRINNGQFSSDRTFKLTVTKTSVSVFEWVTDNVLPLGYVFGSEVYQFGISAQSVPVEAIVYSITNLALQTAGVSIDGSSGSITVDIGWKPSTAYRATLDYVYNQAQLYQCVIAGTSSPSQGPRGTGVNIVDSAYPAWQGGRFYPINSVVNNDTGKIYVSIEQGTSMAGAGPTGTASSILDGSVVWKYVGQSPVWNSIPAGTLIVWSLNCSATLNSQTITRTFQVQLLSVPYQPIWITPAGLLNTLPTQVNYSLQLDAFDPDNLALVWSSSNLPAWLNLSNVGLLWGNTPIIPDNVDNEDFVFDVEISDGVSTVSRNFVLRISNTTQELVWLSPSDLGSVLSGQNSNIVIEASTARRGALLTFGLRGGMIPPNLLIDNDTGALQGFVEYHAQDKTYHFEVLVTDGTETLVKQFSMSVQAQNIGQFVTLGIPILGFSRFDFVSENNASIVDDDQLYLPNDQGWGRTQRPQVTIASGIKRTNTQSLRENLQNYLHNFRISLGSFEVRDIEQKPFGLVTLDVRDADSVQTWQPGKSYARGARITNPDGRRYVATNSGISGTQAPKGIGSAINDGSIIWTFDSVPNSDVDRAYPLPWYPYHLYSVGNTVVNNGLIFQAVTGGRSSGSLGPNSKLASIPDNQVVWTYVGTANIADNNSYWPADVYNLRRIISTQIGWSSSWGTGAIAVANVDTLRGSVSSVQMIAAGSNYWAGPIVNAVGSGSGAEFSVKVGITGANVISSDAGFAVGEIVRIDLDDQADNQAMLLVESVDSLARASQIKVLSSGSFDHIPSNNYTIIVNNKRLVLKFNAGVVAVSVSNGGSGYTSGATIINFAGREYDPTTERFISNFDLCLPLAYTTKSSLPTLVSYLASAENPFEGQVIPVTAVQATVEGIQWQGYARFDSNQETFDSDSTRLIEFDPASETLQDQGQTYWDDRATTFDRNMIESWPDFSLTYFDSNRTIFDYYSTLFDGRKPVYQSRWSSSKLWFFGKPFDV